MKKTLIIGLILTGNAYAFNTVDWARVKNVEPVYGNSTPITRQVCNTQYINRQTQIQPQSNPNVGGAILGGLLGGAVGSQMGKGDGNKAMIAIGSGLGAVIGSQQQNNNQPIYGQTETVPIQNCQNVVEMQPAAIIGYRIILDYNGKDIIYQSPYPPKSDLIQVNVNITPVN